MTKHPQLTRLPCRQSVAGPKRGAGWGCAILQVTQDESLEVLHHHRPVRDLIVDCFGTGMIITGLRHMGTEASSREMLNRSVSTAVSSPVQCLRTCPGTPSGPVAFLGLMCCRVHVTSWGLSTIGEGPCCSHVFCRLC